jgi:hypothetical protein
VAAQQPAERHPPAGPQAETGQGRVAILRTGGDVPAMDSKSDIGYLAAIWVPRFASIWSIADTTASNVSIVEAWRAL